MSDFVEGYFGSWYRDLLVFRYQGHSWWVVLAGASAADLYGNKARLLPAQNGVVTDVECKGQCFKFKCWRVNPSSYIAETVLIADGVIEN